MQSKLGLFLRSVRVRKNLSIEKVEFRLEGTKLKVREFETNPELLPADKLAIYLAAIDISTDEYEDFCEISILEFGRRASRPRTNLKIQRASDKAKNRAGVVYARALSKPAQSSRSPRRKI